MIRPLARGWAHAASLLVLTAVVLRAGDTLPDSPRAIQQELKSFATIGTVLYVAAHPDDENTQLITYLARGRGYRMAYLSVTRGDGGQNQLGSDFGERLGLARTFELLAARRLDGGRQFFTRALDFGFTKDVQETLRIWNHQDVLGDVVRVYRTFRPDVVIAGMNPVQTPGQHGQHVASAQLAIEAFKLAGDPAAFPEQLKEGLQPWQPKRILQNIRFGGSGSPNMPTVTLDDGGDDPVTGESFAAIAARSRGEHKTQMFGNFAAASGGRAGPRQETLALISGDPATGDIMDGLDQTFARFGAAGAEIGALAANAATSFQVDNPAGSVPALLAIRAKLATLPTDPVVADKRAQLDRILQACLGLTVETTVPSAEAVPGEALKLHHAVAIKSKVPVRWKGLKFPTAARVTDAASDVPLDPEETFSTSTVNVLPVTTPVSQPYWLRAEGTAGMFRVDEAKLIGRPINPPAFPVEYLFAVDGQILVIATEPVQLVAGAPEAQAKRKLVAIPPVSLRLPLDVALCAPGGKQSVAVEVTSARAGMAGSVRFDAPAGWKISPARQPFEFKEVGDKATFAFEITAPTQPGTATFTAVATVGKADYPNGRVLINYPHLPLQLLMPPTRLKVTALDLKTRGQRIGYLPGAGDSVADHLTEMGYEVVMLTGLDFTPEKLKGLDAVVCGVRAFNERNDLAGTLPALFAWVEQGGTVIAQYNRSNNELSFPLGPLPRSNDGSQAQLRVTDETAPVVVLAPGHPALNFPNKITGADFDGWVQERGAYFPRKWDARYVPLLAMSDPGEKQPESSLLVARSGKGYFVYTSLSFFRQLPAGVPGAYRLFANLVALGKEQ